MNSAPVVARLLTAPDIDDDVRRRWRALADRAAVANPFLSPEMLLPALRHLPEGRDVRLLVVEDSQLRLLVPVVVSRHWRRVPVPALHTWLHPNLFLGTPLVDSFGDPAPWAVALEHLVRTRTAPWLVLQDCDPVVLQDVLHAAAGRGLETRTVSEHDRAMTRRGLDGTPLAPPMSGRRMKELRRVRRRLSEAAGGLELVDLATDPVPGVDAFLALEAAGWKGRTGGALRTQVGHAEFFRDSCLAMAGLGALQLPTLRTASGRPVAMACNLRDGDGLFHFKIAYDEEWAEWSPGLLLQLDQATAFAASDSGYVDSCAVEDHPMANRIHPDRRRLTTSSIALDRGRGRWAVRHTTDVQRTVELLKRVRAALTGVGRRRDHARTREEQT